MTYPTTTSLLKPALSSECPVVQKARWKGRWNSDQEGTRHRNIMPNENVCLHNGSHEIADAGTFSDDMQLAWAKHLTGCPPFLNLPLARLALINPLTC